MLICRLYTGACACPHSNFSVFPNLPILSELGLARLQMSRYNDRHDTVLGCIHSFFSFYGQKPTNQPTNLYAPGQQRYCECLLTAHTLSHRTLLPTTSVSYLYSRLFVHRLLTHEPFGGLTNGSPFSYFACAHIESDFWCHIHCIIIIYANGTPYQCIKDEGSSTLSYKSTVAKITELARETARHRGTWSSDDRSINQSINHK